MVHACARFAFSLRCLPSMPLTGHATLLRALQCVSAYAEISIGVIPANSANAIWFGFQVRETGRKRFTLNSSSKAGAGVVHRRLPNWSTIAA